MDTLRAVAATSERSADGALAHEIAQRLWQLQSGAAATLNLFRIQKDQAKIHAKLGPLKTQVQNATNGWPDEDGLAGKRLEDLFSDFQDAIRRAARP
jgi:hypothetical protein